MKASTPEERAQALERRRKRDRERQYERRQEQDREQERFEEKVIKGIYRNCGIREAIIDIVLEELVSAVGSKR